MLLAASLIHDVADCVMASGDGTPGVAHEGVVPFCFHWGVAVGARLPLLEQSPQTQLVDKKKAEFVRGEACA
jgi:hypothetical protein